MPVLAVALFAVGEEQVPTEVGDGCCRTTFRARWWRRVDDYCRQALCAVSAEELGAVVVDSDRAVSRWYGCMINGLFARRVGKTRVRARRVSPGCGVNRRRRGAATLMVRAPFAVLEPVRPSKERGRACARELEAVRMTGKLRDGDVRVVMCGDRVGGPAMQVQ